MITTCPECKTAFRVTDEQIGAREGRVRCGKCAAVFDAREALLPRPAESGTERAAEPSAGDDDAEIPFGWPDPKPKNRLYWGLGSGLLALGLLGQTAFHYRGELALLFPEVRPMLAELCTSLGCGVPLPRRSELISIESSDLQADPNNPGVMVLTATLRNRAAFPQAHPSLELTLTDTQDLPLARRVLGPQDYLGRGLSSGAGFPGNSELPVKVYMEASSLKATGYRLYLFYP